jgi:hypothetical protein
LIFDVIINPFFIFRQAVFGAATLAAQRNRLSDPVQVKWRLAPETFEKGSIHNLNSLTKRCDRRKYCKVDVLSNTDNGI